MNVRRGLGVRQEVPDVAGDFRHQIGGVRVHPMFRPGVAADVRHHSRRVFDEVVVVPAHDVESGVKSGFVAEVAEIETLVGPTSHLLRRCLVNDHVPRGEKLTVLYDDPVNARVTRGRIHQHALLAPVGRELRVFA